MQYEPACFKNELFLHEKEHRIIFNLVTFEILTGQSGVYIGDEPANEFFEKTGAIPKVNLEACKQFLVPKEKGYVVKYEINKLITEVRVNAKASKQIKEEIKELCESNNLNFQPSRLA